MSYVSQVNPNFPIPGVDQSSRGFRDNFSVIKTELEDIQNKNIILIGDVVGNASINNGGQDVVIVTNVTVQGISNSVINYLSGPLVVGNITITNANVSTNTVTGVLIVTGGEGIQGNINVGGQVSLFTGNVGIGTSAPLGTSNNILTIYGSTNQIGNLVLYNQAAGESGIYFADGSFQVNATGNLSLGTVGASPNASGATLVGGVLTLEPSSLSNPGLMTATQYSKLSDIWYDVVADGSLVGDGATDNYAFFNTLLSNIASGSVVYFPPGTYNFSAEIIPPYGKWFHFIGADPNISVIQATASQMNIFHLRDSSGPSSFTNLRFTTNITLTIGACIATGTFPGEGNAGVNIINCIFAGPNPDTLVFDCVGYYGTNSGQGSVIRDCTMYNFGRVAIYMYGMVNNTSNTNGSTATLVADNINSNGGNVAITYGIVISQCVSARIINSSFNNSFFGIYANPVGINGYMMTVQDVLISNCFFQDSYLDSAILASTGIIERFKFVGCSFSNLPTADSTTGVEITGFGNVLQLNNNTIPIFGNVFYSNVFPTGVEVIGCSIFNNNNPNATSGINVDCVQDINIQGCSIAGMTYGVILSPNGSPGTLTAHVCNTNFGNVGGIAACNTGVGINDGHAAIGNVIITGNDFTGCIQSLYDNSSIIESTTKLIFNNLGLKNSSFITGNATITNTTISTNTTSGSLINFGGEGIGGNINVGGQVSLYTGNVGIGTSAPLGTSSNVFTVYGSTNHYGNIVLSNLTAGESGIYYTDGSFQTSAYPGPNFGNSNVTIDNLTVINNVTVFGVMFTPNRSAFRVRGANNVQILSGNVISSSNGNILIDHNIGGYYVNSTGEFTAQVVGLYSMFLNAKPYSNVTAGSITIRKNTNLIGSNVLLNWSVPITNVVTTFGVSGYSVLNPGDTVDAYVDSGSISFDNSCSWGVTFIG